MFEMTDTRFKDVRKKMHNCIEVRCPEENVKSGEYFVEITTEN